MNVVSELKELKPHHVFDSAVAFLSTVAPGLVGLFLFRPELLEKYDVLKLILLSASFTLPLWALNLLFSKLLAKDEKQPEIRASCMSVAVLYAPLAISYLFSLGFKSFIALVVVGELWFMLMCLQTRRGPRKRETQTTAGSTAPG